MLLEFLPAWVFKLNLVVFVLCTTSRGKGARSLVNIAVFYLPTVDFMVSSVEVWPHKVVAAPNYLSSYWNPYFPFISCDLPSLSTPVGKFAFLLLLTVVSLAGCWYIFCRHVDHRQVASKRKTHGKFSFQMSPKRVLLFFCLNFSYFPIVKQTLSILRPCHSDESVLYMPNSPCTSHTYSKLTALGIFSAVFYVTGFPLIVISRMIYFFPKRSSMSPEDRKRLDVWLGPVYLSYKPKSRS